MNPLLPGQTKTGNIELRNRPSVVNAPTGSLSTVDSFSFEDDKGNEILIPQIVGGRRLTPEQAIQHYYATGEQLGTFSGPNRVQMADEMGRAVHVQQETSPAVRMLLNAFKF